ncbi:uncharacterized protein LOC123270963 [Cotesia glomerata]|uniref:uncharacterized protein LOC123270963 n=1 Tax=Cotesia glomerata TaxID=32391 RepID=UPI001D02E921|nr:uncharacterized protein LOC123270963 [Cotesia glomerata]
MALIKANGAVGNLIHIEQNEENQVTRIWLVFPDKNTGTVARRKVAAFVAEHNIDKRAVPIVRRTSTISLNNNKTIVGKRNHFPLISGCAMTIHKFQGGTYDEVVYEYSKSHSIPLLYVALTRVTSAEGLFICNSTDDLRFYHGRRVDPSVSSLQHEFERLSLNRLTTLQGLITDFMNSRNKLTIYTLNCQSLRKYAADLQDSICRNSNFLLLTETWCPANEAVDLCNFHCIAKFKRQNVRAAGVQNATEVHVSQTSIGDMCASHVKLEDGSELIMIVVNISPNNKMDHIISFLHESWRF